MSEWPAPLVELMVDCTTLEAVVGAARNSIPDFDRVRRCEANFYGGEWLLLNGSETEAANFCDTRSNCPHNFSLEWVPARCTVEATGRQHSEVTSSAAELPGKDDAWQRLTYDMFSRS